MTELKDRALLIATSLSNVPGQSLLRWQGFHRSENLGGYQTKTGDKMSCWFHRINNVRAGMILEDLRETSDRLEHGITIGRLLYGKWEFSHCHNWSTFNHFLDTLRGNGKHELSEHFKENPVDPNLLALLEAERDKDYKILKSLKKQTKPKAKSAKKK